MSLMKSLARVAAGVMLAKGLGTMMQNQQQSRQGGGRRTGGGILGDLMNAGRGGAMQGRSGGLGDMLGQVLGGLLNGPAQRGAQPANDASFGEVFNDAMSRQDEPEIAPTPEQNAVAGLMLRAMIQAAKADGKIDEAERERLMGQLGDLDEEDRTFVREQMAAPVDAQALAREVPKGLEAQVYTMSLMAIDLDSPAEADYLHRLAEALGIDRPTTNQIHEQVGVQDLYS